MKRSMSTTVMLATLAITLSACGVTGLDSGTVAKIGDSTLTESQLADQMMLDDSGDLDSADPSAVRTALSQWVSRTVLTSYLSGDDGMDGTYDQGITVAGYVCVTALPAADAKSADDMLARLNAGLNWEEAVAETEAAFPGVTSQLSVNCITEALLDDPSNETLRQPIASLTAETPYARITTPQVELVVRFNSLTEVPVENRLQILLEEGPEALRAAVGDELVDAAETPAGNCVSHILVEDLATAQDVLADLESGTDFAAVALDRSIDSGSQATGGALGCFADIAATGFIPEFAAAAEGAELGVPTAPVETQFGFHILLVNDPEHATPEQLATVSATPATLVAAAVESAEVEIDPTFGYFDPASGVIPLG